MRSLHEIVTTLRRQQDPGMFPSINPDFDVEPERPVSADDPEGSRMASKGQMEMILKQYEAAAFKKLQEPYGSQQLRAEYLKMKDSPHPLDKRKASILFQLFSTSRGLNPGMGTGLSRQRFRESIAARLTEKAKSKSQQRFFGAVYACKKDPSKCASETITKTARTISKGEARKFATTKAKGLPEKVKEGAAKGIPNVVGGLSKWLENQDKKQSKNRAKTTKPKKKNVKESISFKDFLTKHPLTK